MADYKFDGKDLRCRGTRIGSIDGKTVRDSHGSRIGEFDGKTIRDSHGSRIGEFDGQVVRDASGSRIATISDVQRAIDGPGGASLTALWMLLVR
jgi:hypothetical protein